jgi:molybdopterin/thiamine biosynthesis adenylyltransferase
MALSDAEVARYARQLLLPGMGEAAQERLRDARIRVSGGGLATAPAVYYLAAAGVGTLWIDDPDPVGPGDGAGFALGPDEVGKARGPALAAFAGWVNGTISASAFRPGFRPTAALVCGATLDVSRAIADEARLLRLPHVVADVDGQGGAATTVPVGAPCYACATRPGLGAPPTAEGGATVGALAALELLLLLTAASQEPRARRVEVFRGTPLVRTTERQPGCACMGPSAAGLAP